MNTYLLGIYEKAIPEDLGWEERLKTAKEAGFDFLEISMDETEGRLKRLEWTRDERLKLLDIIYKTGIPMKTMCLSGHRKFPLGSHDEAVRNRSLDIMEKAIILASDLGIRIVQLAGYDVYYEEGDEETRGYFLENLKKSVDMAAAHGVSLGFETMETPFMDTISKAMAYVNKVNSPYLGVYPDLGNLTNACYLYGLDVNEEIEAGKGHLMAMHLKDTVEGVYRNLEFGEGRVDFEAGIKKAKEMGVRLFNAECWYTGKKEWKENLRKGNALLRGFLDAP
ncbi:MAG: L-ribulose-5-phosphate 3-epimerase [Bacillota bacterium]|nr:L-ribulose-5-phosphate 3-epimerase [Bacillota bacterium]